MAGSKGFDLSQKNHGKRRQGMARLVCYAMLLVVGLYVGFQALQAHDAGAGAQQQQAGQHSSPRRVLRDGAVVTDTLVIYIFSNTDPEYIENLRFFAQFGMKEGDGCEYVVVVQEDEKASAAPLHPALQPALAP